MKKSSGNVQPVSRQQERFRREALYCVSVAARVQSSLLLRTVRIGVCAEMGPWRERPQETSGSFKKYFWDIPDCLTGIKASAFTFHCECHVVGVFYLHVFPWSIYAHTCAHVCVCVRECLCPCMRVRACMWVQMRMVMGRNSVVKSVLFCLVFPN